MLSTFIRFSKNLNLENNPQSGAQAKDLETYAVCSTFPSKCLNNHIFLGSTQG
jgi:hypothetical protein